MGIEFTNEWEDALLSKVREAKRLDMRGSFTKASAMLSDARKMLEEVGDINPTQNEDSNNSITGG